MSPGGALFDEAFHPSGAEAQRLHEQEKRTIVPAPSPDKGPDAIDVEGGRITLDVSMPGRGNAPAPETRRPRRSGVSRKDR